MRSREMNIVFAIIMILPRLGAFSDSAQSSIDQKTMMAAAGNPNVRKQMSCYVCSTMDYENPQENSCKSMPKLVRQSTGAASHHPSSMSFAHQPQSSSTTSSPTVAALTVALDHSPSGQAATSRATTDSSTSDEQATQFDPSTGMARADLHQLAPNTTGGLMSARLQQQQHLTSSPPATGNNFPYQQHRLQQNTLIRKRPCLEDENFCSIVSVVRIEFVNDTLVQRFWAMERNCSKSCNTGCMLIGERVRLRVCSQCCRTPDCNVGSGTTTVYAHNLMILLISLILLKLNPRPKVFERPADL